MTILATKQKNSIDVMVKPEQRIKEVIRVLTQNCRLPLQLSLGDVVIYSKRQKRYLSEMLTFKQAQIYDGDILQITSDNTFGGKEADENKEEQEK